MASSILEVHEAVFVQTDLTPRLGTTLYLSHLVLTRVG